MPTEISTYSGATHIVKESAAQVVDMVNDALLAGQKFIAVKLDSDGKLRSLESSDVHTITEQ